MQQSLFAYSQYFLPKRLLSRLMGKLAESENEVVKNTLIKLFLKRYPQIDMQAATISDPYQYASFNAFFIRTLKKELRPLASGTEAIASPVDGSVAQYGSISDKQLLQAKGFNFDLASLLGNEEDSTAFLNGQFATLYLAPYHYHRVHMPIAGTLKKAIFIPGSLFSVNKTTAAYIPKLYSRNERLVTIFETASGPMAIILVGAMIVGSINPVWAMPESDHSALASFVPEKEITLAKGAELGHFKMGSTVIVLFAQNKMAWEFASTEVLLGSKIGALQGQ